MIEKSIGGQIEVEAQEVWWAGTIPQFRQVVGIDSKGQQTAVERMFLANPTAKQVKA